MAFVAWFTYRQVTAADQGEGQSRRASIAEAWVNIVIGFSINFAMNLVLIPEMTEGGTLTHASNFWGGWIYTAVSMLRQYGLRRIFNSHIQRFATWVARITARRKTNG